MKESAKEIRAVDYETVTSLDPAMVTLIRSLWTDGGVLEAYDRRREFQLGDSAK